MSEWGRADFEFGALQLKTAGWDKNRAQAGLQEASEKWFTRGRILQRAVGLNHQNEMCYNSPDYYLRRSNSVYASGDLSLNNSPKLSGLQCLHVYQIVCVFVCAACFNTRAANAQWVHSLLGFTGHKSNSFLCLVQRWNPRLLLYCTTGSPQLMCVSYNTHVGGGRERRRE